MTRAINKAAWKAMPRQERRDIVTYSQCDTGRNIGLLRGYMARDFEDLRRVRNRPVATRGETVKRKADFYFVLARMADRLDRMPKLSEIF